MTYTLLARDPESGDIGLAIASCWPAVGGVVPYYHGDVGVVASQSSAHSAMAEEVLAHLASGDDPETALTTVLPRFTPEIRQVIVLAHDGARALRTGSAVLTHVSEAYGPDCVAAGNLLANDTICPAMIDRYLRTGDDRFADRLLAALHAGETAGGDRRGREAAAIRIWPRHYPDPDLLPLDIRADNDPDPIAVLERTLARRRAVEQTRY